MTKKTLAPAWARSYEPPSISGAESVGVVRFLMSVEAPTPAIIAAVEGAVEWFRSTAIYGIRLEAFTDTTGQDDKTSCGGSQRGPALGAFLRDRQQPSQSFLTATR